MPKARTEKKTKNAMLMVTIVKLALEGKIMSYTSNVIS